MKKNTVEISFTGNNFSAHIPALPGCVSVGDTMEEIKNNIYEAINFHLQGMQEDGDALPKSFAGDYKIVYKFDYSRGLNKNSFIFKLSNEFYFINNISLNFGKGHNSSSTKYSNLSVW